MTSRSPANRGRRPAAFTLVELMVAMTVSIVLLILLVNLSVQSMDVTKHTSENSRSLSSAADQGQVRGACYRLVQRNPITGASGADALYGLYRTAETAALSFEKLLGQGDIGAYAGFNPPPAAGDFLVPNVIEFQIAFYRADASKAGSANLPINLDGSSYVPVRLSGSSVMIGGNKVTTGRPTSAEITLIVLDETGAQLLRKGSVPLDTAIQKYGHRLARRVNLAAPK